MNLDNHPCFNVRAHKKYGRVHLPVAPRCNIQCNFCNRKFDCVNESRPGVTSGLLTPFQAMAYLEEVFRQKQNISVVGIAGPGDPFANPEETMETLRRVRETYPEMILCIATNGLYLEPYVDELADLKVSHVTVTVNAVDPAIGSKIYSWVRYDKRVMRSEKGAEILLARQLSAIRKLKSRGITVKINSIIIPGINDDHIEAVAEKMAELDVDILNCVPYYPNKGSVFEDFEEPSKAMVKEIRDKAGKYVKQMRHCTRCRADAVGLLGETPSAGLMRKLQECGHLSEENPRKKYDGTRSYVAVASMEGVLVNQHLGEASKLMIYGEKDGMITLLEARDTPPKGGGFQRWEQLADETLGDCGTLLVSGIGENPRRLLTMRGIDILEIEGVIDEAVRAVFEGNSLKHLIKRNMTACGAGCSGTGMGCG
ncbi:nitrogenase cofactor biosynthesis protein NifB [Desulfonema ishimotonii]|uniref:FeMo cofactor biosynthesis protein NifB n=1 Tax=Desulfonema ishimotonii TaxID=45657 RepID=A0A401FXQ7_9BACT|nr:nitrogenase cofactor biosynthesis protein NifB [Desulfonema ishimotonii]GBC61750.1 nitrogenase cofactor biosynthesis protein NifB [Desulfonema ishimotonii]